MDQLSLIRQLNKAIFEEARVINSFDHNEIVMTVAWWDGEPAGFKVGYDRPESVFYSAKGGVLPPFRRRGIARALLYDLMERARMRGYGRFVYDTFPNKHPGMAVMGFTEGFTLVRAGFNTQYGDYRLRLARDL